MGVNARPWLDRIEPYRPGRHAANPDGSMASNESPLGASRRVVEAVTNALAGTAHYPDPLADRLRGQLARLHDVHPDQILVGNGSDELIYLLAWAFLADGGHAVCADPPYRIDEISSAVVNARVTKVPLRDWTHDLAAMARVEADLAYVVNPHNPTGTVCSPEAIEEFVSSSRAGLVVVDEAYVDFADDPARATAMPLARAGRAVVLRTFSKVHGLAGLRVGYVVGPVEVLDVLRKIRAPFSVGSLPQAAACAALEDDEHHRRVREHTLRLRTEVTALLAAADFVVVPSQANFVLVQTPGMLEAALVEHLAADDVSVRPGTALGAPGTVRVSMPTDTGLQMLRASLDRWTALHRPALTTHR
jgi:histidinol-phosphate aminotransferase